MKAKINNVVKIGVSVYTNKQMEEVINDTNIDIYSNKYLSNLNQFILIYFNIFYILNKKRLIKLFFLLNK